MNVNKVFLVGRLTRDPEMRSTSGGQTVASLSIATNRFWKDKNGQRQDQTEFHNIVLWSRLAEIAGQYLIKGQEVYIEGRLQTRKYTAKDGTERRTTEIVAENMQLGQKSRGQSGQGYQTSGTPATPEKKEKKEISEEDIPTINLDEEDEVKIEDVPF
ncbi:MAG: single-stranded DNA-binding protein [Candidatus Moranbacteria bacterium CG_4_8_14_3_um_filter_34_16]|nr:MAG: single-stranded DNA-binding protein [Candidatus Moranbacteria bacterium CG08_land_8_20_14_0_20_34_16]PIW94859.1 MAG: single-stranded DNA-binding protein [Candidatus Moranbacteria bacterium CG_4_8_14_3_um_filter_34_16]PJA89142.1 MAG: single-stranded DNA-binding protein [Candidatus Moranbacteria bacterium CG_4_9_14_3_um_filter_33_15]